MSATAFQRMRREAALKAALAETADLEGMTVKQLTEYAANAGIDLGAATKKADILKAIQDAGAKPAEGTEPEGTATEGAEPEDGAKPAEGTAPEGTATEGAEPEDGGKPAEGETAEDKE